VSSTRERERTVVHSGAPHGSAHAHGDTRAAGKKRCAPTRAPAARSQWAPCRVQPGVKAQSQRKRYIHNTKMMGMMFRALESWRWLMGWLVRWVTLDCGGDEYAERFSRPTTSPRDVEPTVCACACVRVLLMHRSRSLPNFPSLPGPASPFPHAFHIPNNTAELPCVGGAAERAQGAKRTPAASAQGAKRGLPPPMGLFLHAHPPSMTHMSFCIDLVRQS
jgi:hypothetical protein